MGLIQCTQLGMYGINILSIGLYINVLYLGRIR